MSDTSRYKRMERLLQIASALYGLTFRELTRRMNSSPDDRNKPCKSLGSVHRRVRGDVWLPDSKIAPVLDVVASGINVPKESVQRYIRSGESTDGHLASLVESEFFGNSEDAGDKMFERLVSEVTGVSHVDIYAREIPVFMVDRQVRARLPGIRRLSEYHRQRLNKSAERVRGLLDASRGAGCQCRLRLSLASEAFDELEPNVRDVVDDCISSQAATWDIHLERISRVRLPTLRRKVPSSMLVRTSRGSLIQSNDHGKMTEFWSPKSATARSMEVYLQHG
jgi:hypothetical protein